MLTATAASITTTVTRARARAVEFLNDMARDEDLENVEPIVALVNDLLAAAGAAAVRREYRAEVAVKVSKQFDDYITVEDEDALKDPIIERVTSETDNLDDVEIDEIDTEIRVEAAVTARALVTVLVTDPDADTLNGLEAAILEAAAQQEIYGDWEIDTDEAEVGDIAATFV